MTHSYISAQSPDWAIHSGLNSSFFLPNPYDQWQFKIHDSTNHSLVSSLFKWIELYLANFIYKKIILDFMEFMKEDVNWIKEHPLWNDLDEVFCTQKSQIFLSICLEFNKSNCSNRDCVGKMCCAHTNNDVYWCKFLHNFAWHTFYCPSTVVVDDGVTNICEWCSIDKAKCFPYQLYFWRMFNGKMFFLFYFFLIFDRHG